jgi:hypothetical protein
MFLKQLAQIERRRARIRQIRLRNHISRQRAIPAEQLLPAACAESHHHIGKSQNFPHDLSHFYQGNLSDPAAKVHALFQVSSILN